jgi:transposase
MGLPLKEIAQAVAPGAQAAVLLDRAGWHVSTKLAVPDNITLVPLPPRSPELNPVENVWQFLRENWLSNRVFRSYEDILDHCCAAWNKLIDQPWRIMSIGLREWAHGF